MLENLRSEDYVINCISGLCKLNRELIDKVSGITLPFAFEFIPMELADYSAEQYIYAKDINAIDNLLCFKEMIKAVKKIHGRRICHRDLKPSNFLISRNKIFLSDFGTAKCMDGGDPDISLAYPYPVGDLTYTAPETMFSLGIADEYVFRSDIFSMGAILFEMFTQTVLTVEIYSDNILKPLLKMYPVISSMTKEKRFITYQGVVDNLAKRISLPDIYSYNNNVPQSIKNQLNGLYKNLVAINFSKRLVNTQSIHRKIDICILTLRNEKKYLEWQERKRKRKDNKFKKQLKKMGPRRI